MNKEEEFDFNLLCGNFIGLPIDIDNHCQNSYEVMNYFPDLDYSRRVSHFEFSTNWNWIMRVIEKIESIYDDYHGYFRVHISSNNCVIQGTKFRSDPENFHPTFFSDHTLSTKIESTVHAINNFLNWYNNYSKSLND